MSKDGDSTKGEAAAKEQVSKSLGQRILLLLNKTRISDHDQVGAPAPSSGGGFHPGWKLAKCHVANLQRVALTLRALRCVRVYKKA